AALALADARHDGHVQHLLDAAVVRVDQRHTRRVAGPVRPRSVVVIDPTCPRRTIARDPGVGVLLIATKREPLLGNPRRVLSPLLEEVRNSSIYALIPQRSRPVRVHRTSAVARLGPSNDPATPTERKKLLRHDDGPEQRLGAQEAHRCWYAQQFRDPLVGTLLVF